VADSRYSADPNDYAAAIFRERRTLGVKQAQRGLCAIYDPKISRNVYLRRGEHVSASLAEAFFAVLQRVAEENSHKRLTATKQ